MRRASAFLLLALASAAEARVVRVEIERTEPLPPHEGAPAYERVTGVFHGELDPRSPGNRMITDLARAPRTARGLVSYSANFSIVRATDPARRSGLLFYQVPNRGNPVAQRPDPDGHTLVASGWQGDVVPRPSNYWARVPVVAGITGTVLFRLAKIPADARSTPILQGLAVTAAQPVPASLETRRARLVIERDGQRDEAVAASDWAFADCTATPFPGTPDPARLCLRRSFDPDAAYRLTYTAKDPPVLGIGFAATRDLIAFLREGRADDASNANPAGSGVRWTIGVGDSQSGNYLRSFVLLGFNADEAGRRVFDGINPNIAARQISLNLRFAQPSGASGPYQPGSEGIVWWGRHDDRARQLGTGSLLDRCTASGTCPKVVETLGSAEFWGLRASPGFVGVDAKGDIALPANVRRYYFPSVTHGGAIRGGFLPAGEPHFMGATCQLPANPNPVRDQMRVARRMLIAWVKDGTQPPPSRAPTLAAGDLVAPTAAAMGWPAIPGAPVPDGHINPLYDYDFGPGLIARDMSGVLRQPPRVRRTLEQRAPRVNADGNETSGVPSVYLQVPLGTYTGWNVEARGVDTGRNCGFVGGFIPFARTKAEREAKRDPRPSLEERYGDQAGFVSAVRAAAAREAAAGWLLPDDAARIVRDAEASDVLQ
jgi:Alpha/beta hydrolase domain